MVSLCCVSLLYSEYPEMVIQYDNLFWLVILDIITNSNLKTLIRKS